MLTINSVAAYWATQPSLTSLVPADKVWVDVAANTDNLPYVILSQIDQKPQWQSDGHYISRCRFQITVYATTLATVSTIVDAILAAFKWKDVSSAGFGCRLENIIPKGEDQGDYSCVVEYTLFEWF